MKGLILILVLFLFNQKAEAKIYSLTSPDGKITVQITVDKVVRYSIQYKNMILVYPSAISLILEKKQNDSAPVIISETKYSAQKKIIPPVKEKRGEIPDIYNELVLKTNQQIELHFRAYNDGVAYRFASGLTGEITVKDEVAEFHFAPGARIYFGKVIKRADADIFHTAFEEPYTISGLDSLDNDLIAYSPVLLSLPGLPKVLITESDVDDYPGMFLTSGEKSSLKGLFAPYPLKENVSEGEFKQKLVLERAGYIAKTKGNRTFPWRVIAIAPSDADLLMNDIVYRLAPEPSFSDFSWIKPGLSTEEWITGLNLYGVDFIAGINTETYKYYIDFAARFDLEYVMLDAGWSDVNDLFSISEGMDMDEITSYARSKGVGLILWTQALTIERQMEAAFEQFKKWDIKIVMTDFIDRDDQKAINFMHRFASECAKYKFMCMIHGAPPPKGFSRTYPNMLTREGILGSEYNIWSAKANPEHDLLLPFIRMVAGPMDYEPGILQNATRENSAKFGFEKVIAQGTRMHQIAMFIVYESPLQLFSGNLSDAIREPELMDFLGKIPTEWDETIILKAEMGKFIVEARRNGNTWYLGAMNDWEPVSFTIPCDFLEDGEYTAEIACDGINAVKNPHDYKIFNKQISNNGSLSIELAPGGGYVARISKKHAISRSLPDTE